MKKILFAMIAATALSASAVELGVYGTRNLAGSDVGAAGVSIAQGFGPVKATAFVDRTLNRSHDVNRLGVLGSYNVISYGPVSFNVQAGAARIVNTGAQNGYAFISGVGASYAVTKNTAVTLDFRNQQGQSRVSALNGNSISLGAKYAF